MNKNNFFGSLQQEVERIDAAKTAKRFEHLIEDFTDGTFPKAVINGKLFSIYNSNDYLGFRHHPELKRAEHEASQRLGTGPGAVRFISGSFKVHRDLEKTLAAFHGRPDCIVFSSAFAANLAVIFSLVRGQSKDSLISNNTLVISDELNHRSIIDGVRLANLGKGEKLIFRHLDLSHLGELLRENAGKFDRVVVITDGVFSMLGEYQNLKQLQAVTEAHDALYSQGILSIVDDCHGVAAFGKTGRGCEEISQGKADVLVGTLGKGFGVDGGYAVADQIVIDYLRESAATYIYSNSIAPGGAAAAKRAVEILDSEVGHGILERLESNITLLKDSLTQSGFDFAAESVHPIQPVLIGDPVKTKQLIEEMYARGFLLSAINYPVVPKGRDEIRVQLNASHTEADIQQFAAALKAAGEKMGIT